MDGVLNIRKAAGPTSHDVVDEVRSVFGQRRVGHAGSLDPMATGVLVVCLGKATRVVEHLMGTPKEYRAQITFGRSTDTQDSTGETVAEGDASGVTPELLKSAASQFVGEIEQVPPMVSAVKYKGKPLYKLARRGESVERKPRKVVIYSIEASAFEPGPSPRAEMLVTCSSGTYIRTLCADIGRALDCGAHMSALERTRVGRFRLEDSVTVAQLNDAAAEDRLDEYVIGISDALSDLPAISLDEGDTKAVLHGRSVVATDASDLAAQVRLLSPKGELIALGIAGCRDGKTVIRPCKGLAEPDDQ